MRKFLYAASVLLLLCICGLIYSESIQGELSKSLLRLHIIADSDSAYDQQIKLAVRNAVLEEITAKKSRSSHAVISKLSDIEKSANNALKKLNAPYHATAEYSYFYVPAKKYNNLSLPEGRYRGIRLKLGAASGKNWWCVAYPPLCFNESVCGELSSEGSTQLLEILSDESYQVISSQAPEFRYKWKIVELYQAAKAHIRKN